MITTGHEGDDGSESGEVEDEGGDGEEGNGNEDGGNAAHRLVNIGRFEVTQSV